MDKPLRWWQLSRKKRIQQRLSAAEVTVEGIIKFFRDNFDLYTEDVKTKVKDEDFLNSKIELVMHDGSLFKTIDINISICVDDS